MSEFLMPALGADMDAGTLVEWCVHPGDQVKRGQIVAVVETQKGAIDVEIFEDGEIVEFLVQPVTSVPVGTPLAIYRKPGEELSATRSATTVVAASQPPIPQSTAGVVVRVEGRVSPRARKLAGELGVDLAKVIGTGPDGSITGEDVEAAAGPSVAKPSASPGGGMRQAIAAAMSRSKREIPHYYLFHTIDLEPALTWLEARNGERLVAERLLPVVLLVRAVAKAAGEHPGFSGFWREGQFVAGSGIHVGLAVALREGGLINPAIHDADRGPLDPLMATIRDVSQRARQGGLRASELSDPTLTITSLGDRGVDGLLGVISPPQVAIIGFGTLRSRPWIVDGQVVARRLIECSLAADHRVSDGHAGARFLAKVDRLLQQPETL